MTDVDTKFSQLIGWTRGERTGRYAMIIDHGKVTYAENESGGDVTVGSAEREADVCATDNVTRFLELRQCWQSFKNT